MNTSSTIARERVNAEFFPVTEQPHENSSGFRSPSSTTISVLNRFAFDELIAGARAAAQHQLSIANARRFFSDADASKAVADAEAFAALIENQILKLKALPALASLNA